MRRAESIIAKLALVVASLLIVCAIIEAAAAHYLWNIATEDEFQTLASINQIKERYGDDFYAPLLDKRNLSWSPHHYLGYTPTPNFQRDENRHNALGFRGEEIALAKPPRVYRIVAIGGSTTYSIDVKDYRDSYPGLLGDHLRAKGYDQVEVVNAGAIAYSSYHNLVNLAFRVLPLAPDLIIVLQGFNDIDARFVHPPSKYLGDNSGYAAPIVSDTVTPDLLEYSTAFRLLGIRLGFARSQAALDWHYAQSAPSSQAAELKRQLSRNTYPSGIFKDVSALEMLRNNPPAHFERNLRNMLAVAAANEVEVLLLTMPLSRNFHARTESRDKPFISSELYAAALAEHNDITRRVAAAAGAPLFDLAVELPDDPALFTDGLHMNVDGNRLRARLIGDFVSRHFLAL